MAKSNKIMIQVCLCGAGTKKDKAPTVPYTADELAEQIVACAKLGASIAHIHVREDKEVDGVMQIGYKSMSLQKFASCARRRALILSSTSPPPAASTRTTSASSICPH